MRNKTGKPFVTIEFDEKTKEWVIYFNPAKLIDGQYSYSEVRGKIDPSEAETIAKAIDDSEYLF